MACLGKFVVQFSFELFWINLTSNVGCTNVRLVVTSKKHNTASEYCRSLLTAQHFVAHFITDRLNYCCPLLILLICTEHQAFKSHYNSIPTLRWVNVPSVIILFPFTVQMFTSCQMLSKGLLLFKLRHFYILTTSTIKATVFCGVTPCGFAPSD
jgi:hypothetical protein